MLVIRIDEEIEGQLADILAHKKDTKHGELIKRLIRAPWLTLQLGKSIVERRGGHPQHLLQDAPADLSQRANRKRAIAIHAPVSTKTFGKVAIPALVFRKDSSHAPELNL